MTLPSNADRAIRDKLATYTDPYLGQTLGEAKAVESVTVQNGTVHIALQFGFPVGGYVDELSLALRLHLAEVLDGAPLQLAFGALEIVAGYLLTAFAVTLGAPFWFDLLQNIMHLRDAGPPPKRSDALAE